MRSSFTENVLQIARQRMALEYVPLKYYNLLVDDMRQDGCQKVSNAHMYNSSQSSRQN